MIEKTSLDMFSSKAYLERLMCSCMGDGDKHPFLVLGLGMPQVRLDILFSFVVLVYFAVLHYTQWLVLTYCETEPYKQH